MRKKNLRMTLGIMFLLAFPCGLHAQETDDFYWPKSLQTEKYEIIIYQPQIEAFAGNALESRAAVAVKPTGSDEMIFGAMWFESVLATDQDARTATLEKVTVSAARFPDVEPEKVEALSRFLEQEIPQWDLTLSIDRLLAGLAASEGAPQGEEGFNNEAPRIYFRTAPAVLVLVDGDPIFTEMGGFALEYVANSAFFIVRDSNNKQNYLRGSGMWFTAADLGGPWRVTTDLPGEVAKVSVKIEEEEKTRAAEAAEDAEALGVEKAEDATPPEIILSTVPAELITTDGDMDFASVEGTQLLYLKNSENDVLMDIAQQQYYALLAGRWYRTKSMSAGPWEFVPFDQLPEDFGKIPSGSDMATVLPSVPGTQVAREAVLETQIPQTAEVDRKTATCEVTYDGDPQFESCGDDVAYALNTDKSVLLIDGQYYCVDSAVWFVAGGPQGPWKVATEVPAVVQDLPPDCPVYNVKYVYIYESTPEVVYVGYTPGYYGSYVYGPCVVYGTGWYYRPWWGTYYYPRPVTYGFGVHYSPYGGWGYSFGVSYGWLTIGVGWGRPPYGCWGPAGYRYGYRSGYWHGYNRGYNHGYRRGAAAGYRAGYRAGQKQPRPDNAYRNRKDGVKRTGDIGKQARQRPATSDRRNNVYSDRNGDVYRDKDGSWEKRDKGEWSKDDRTRDQDRTRDRDKNVDRSRPEQPRDRSGGVDRSREGGRQQLDRDRSSRNRGNDRQRQAPSRGGGRGGGGRGGRR